MAGGRGGFTTGERLTLVKLRPKRLARMRTRKRVATGAPAWMAKNSESEAGTSRRSSFAVPTGAFTKTARAPSRLNTTVFLFLPRRKFFPRISIVSPMATSMGRTEVTTG